MLYDQDILLNYPRLYDPHTRGAREYFYDYGTPLSVDVEPQQNNGNGRVNFVYQKNLSCNNTDLVLIPRGPCRPIIPPNPFYNINEEPCMHRLREMEEETNELLSFLNVFAYHAKLPKEKVIQMFKEKLEKIENQIERSSSEDFDDVHVNKDDDKIFRSIAGIAKQHEDVFGNYNNLWKKNYNPRYAGGCLSFHPLEGQKEPIGVLVYPTGRNMDSLTFGITFHKNGSEMCLEMSNSESAFDMEGLIHQISTELVRNRIFCLARTNRRFAIFGLSDDEDNNDRSKLVHLVTSDWPIGNTLSHVSLSPHLMGEVLVSTEEGSVYLWALERSQKEIFKIPKMTNPVEKVIEGYPTHAHFTGHPRCFVVSTADSINVIDDRTANGKSSCLIKLSTNETFHGGEKITCSHRPGPGSTHHLFASQLSLGLIDERFPDHVVLKWNHSFLSPPTFMDVLPSIIGIEDETLITLASQDQGEVHCFQCHGVAIPFDQINPSPSKVQMCGPPWRTCRPKEILMGSMRNVKKRLTCPLIGQCIVPNESQRGFSILQMTSIGDLFCQDYHGEQGYPNDSKTFQMPSQHLNSHDLDSFRELFAYWLRDCRALPNGNGECDDNDDDDGYLGGGDDCGWSLRNKSRMRKRLGDTFRRMIDKDNNDNYSDYNNNNIDHHHHHHHTDNKKMDVSEIVTFEDEEVCQKCTKILTDINDDDDEDDDDDDDGKFDLKCLSCKERKFQSSLREDKVPPSIKVIDLTNLTSKVELPPKDDDAEGQILFAQYREVEFVEFLKMRDEETIKDCKELLKNCMPVDEEKSELENDYEDDY